MDKQTAVSAFGSVGALAQALGVSRQAIYKWPDDLPQRTTDLVVGAAVRLNRPIPNGVTNAAQAEHDADEPASQKAAA